MPKPGHPFGNPNSAPPVNGMHMPKGTKDLGRFRSQSPHCPSHSASSTNSKPPEENLLDMFVKTLPPGTIKEPTAANLTTTKRPTSSSSSSKSKRHRLDPKTMIRTEKVNNLFNDHWSKK